MTHTLCKRSMPLKAIQIVLKVYIIFIKGLAKYSEIYPPNSNIFKRWLMIYLTTWKTPSDHFKHSDHYENYDGSTHSEPFYFSDHSDPSDHSKHSDN